MIKVFPLQNDIIDKTVKEIISQNNNKDFSSYSVIFPNKRMILFFKEKFMSEIKNSACFPPKMYSMKDFLIQIFNNIYKDYKQAEKIDTIIALYKIINKNFNANNYLRNENFVDFFPLGEKLSKVMDKMMSQKAKININSKIYKEFTELGTYFKEFKGYINILPQLMEKYLSFLEKSKLYTDSFILYKLAQFKNEVEQICSSQKEKLIICGLNVLNPCEEIIYNSIVKSYNESTIILKADIEAFKNKRYPYRLLRKSCDFFKTKIYFSDAPKNKSWKKGFEHLSIIETSDQEDELKILYNKIKKIFEENSYKKDKLTEIGILIGDSTILIPLIQNLISAFKEEDFNNGLAFNISVNYPFSRTALFVLLENISDIYQNSINQKINRKKLLSLITHPYFKLLMEKEERHLLREDIYELQKILKSNFSENIEFSYLKNKIQNLPLNSIKKIYDTFFKKDFKNLKELLLNLQNILNTIKSSKGGYILVKEFCACALQEIESLFNIDKELLTDSTNFNIKSSFRIIISSIKNIGVSFFGSPLKGIQVMELLEYRNINFKKIFILDASDDNFPGKKSYDPLLPQDIKKIFKMQSQKDNDEIHAANFFSLINSCDEVETYYCQNEEKILSKSRFLEEMIFESQKAKKELSVTTIKPCQINVRKKEKIFISKTPSMLKKIEELKFSTTSLTTYQKCPKKFFFQYILNLNKNDEENENLFVGNLSHKCLQSFYELNHQNLKPELFVPKFIEEYKNSIDTESLFKNCHGIEKLRKFFLEKMIINFLKVDLKLIKENSSEILKHELKIELDKNNSILKGHYLKGSIDRLQKENSNYIITDYKTGKKNSAGLKYKEVVNFEYNNLPILEKKKYLEKLNKAESIFNSQQIMFYILLLAENNKISLDKIKGRYAFTTNEDSKKIFVDIFKETKNQNMDDFIYILKEYKNFLNILVKDMKERDYFYGVYDKKTCKYCQFSNLC